MADFNKKVTLIEVDIDNDAAIAAVERSTNALLAEQSALKKNNEQIKELEKSQKDINKEQEKGIITSKEAEKLRNQNAKQIETLKKSNLNLKDGIKDLNRERTQAVKVSKLQANSLDALRAETSKLVKTRDSLDKSTVEGTKKFEALNDQIAENQTEIIGADKSANLFKSSIGDYAGQVEEAGGATGGLGGSILDIGKKFISFGKILLANPIGLIVTAVVSLVGLFASLGDNVAFLEPIFAGVQAVLDTVIGRLAKLGGAIVKFFQGDFAGALDEATGAFEGLGEEIARAFDKGREIKQLEQSLRSLSRESSKAVALLQGESELLQSIADDATKSFKERETAAAAARIALEDALALRLEEANLEKRIADERLLLAKSQGKDVRDLLDQQAEAAVKQIELESELTLAIRDNEKVRSELKQDRLEKDLDILIDGFDNFKTITEKAIADTDKPLEERILLLGRLTKESENAFDEQVSTLQKFSKQQIDIIDLINETDTKALNDKIRNLELSEIIEGRLLEVIRERRLVISDLAEAEKDLNAEKVEREELEIERQEEAAEEERDRLFANLEKLQEIRDKKTAEELEKLEEKEETKKEIVKAALDAASNAISLAFDVASDRREREFDDESTQLELKHQDEQAQLRQNLDNGLISQDEFDKKSIELEKKFALEQHAIALAEFNANKKASLVEIAISTAVAAAKVLPNLIASGVVLAAGALQAIAVGTQQPPQAPQFAQGGGVFGTVIRGKSHAQGGENIHVGGKLVANMQGDEGLFVTKKEATNPALALLSGVNERFGGASMFGNSSRFLQQGGPVGGLGASDISRLASEIVKGLPTPVVEVQSVMAGINADIDAKAVGIK
jgi:hypothetical protein